MTDEPKGYNPPVFVWIAEYVDGTCLCQFDPADGHENLFKQVDHSRLKSFGWYPVTSQLKAVVTSMELRCGPSCSYKISIGPGEKLIAHRQQHIRHNVRTREEERWTIYVLGKSFVCGESTVRQIVRIDENGNVEM